MSMTESMKLPDDMVGYIIGHGGENIMKMQRETGCRIQISQNIPGTKDRPCTLSGTPEQIEVCRNMLNLIVSESQSGKVGRNLDYSPGLFRGNAGGMGDGAEQSKEIPIPADKCGLIIGKGGETIKTLQQSWGVKMHLIQDTTENVGQAKPLRISGPPMHVENAVNAVNQLMTQRDKQIAEQKMDQSAMFGDNMQVVSVPKAAVGVVIGKGGDMINQIQNVTATRIQFQQDDPSLPERLCTITGPKEGVEAAIRRIQEIIQNVQERDGLKAAGNRGGMPPPVGGAGSFGQWEAPNMNRGRGMGVTTEEYLVPANKTGLVIGKGGETIKQINMQSGAHAEIQKHPPSGSDPDFKTFFIKGTPDQIKMARQLMQERIDSYVSGSGGPMGGAPNQAPQPGGFAPQPQQNSFGSLPPVASFAPAQNPMQAAPQGQPGQSFQQQPWANQQFQQWNQSAATQPQPNGTVAGKPVADANAAAWQTYFQYAQSQPGFQAPTVSAAAPTATSAAPAGIPDYSKQWDEYLKQTGAAALPAQTTPAAAAAAQALQQQVASPPAGAAVAGQPPTTQTDYSAAWAEYYRQVYQMQAVGQQFAAAAAAAGQAPAQN